MNSIALVFVNLLLPLISYLFGRGFFAYKPFLAGSNDSDIPVSGGRQGAQFNKVILMVVDALRRLVSRWDCNASVFMTRSLQ